MERPVKIPCIECIMYDNYEYAILQPVPEMLSRRVVEREVMVSAPHKV